MTYSIRDYKNQMEGSMMVNIRVQHIRDIATAKQIAKLLEVEHYAVLSEPSDIVVFTTPSVIKWRHEQNAKAVKHDKAMERAVEELNKLPTKQVIRHVRMEGIEIELFIRRHVSTYTKSGKYPSRSLDLVVKLIRKGEKEIEENIQFEYRTSNGSVLKKRFIADFSKEYWGMNTPTRVECVKEAALFLPNAFVVYDSFRDNMSNIIEEAENE